MRFNKIPMHVIIWVPLAVWLVKSLVLGAQGKLGVYIHPRFFGFTIILCAAGLVLVLWHVLRPAAEDSHGHASGTQKPNAWFTILCLLVAVATAMMPPLTLSASSVINRGSETYSAPSLKLSARYDQFTIKEWSSLLAQSNDPLSLVGKPAAFEGFLSKPQSDSGQPAMISRFGVTCCAIDAQPISLPVRSELLQGVPANQWLRIAGTWQRDGASEQGVSILLTKAEAISMPKEPYVY